MLELRDYQAHLPARIHLRIVEKPGPLATPCYVWTGHTSSGYASARWEGPERKLHVVLYRLLVGLVPDGLVLDHLCRVRACLNVAHMEPVTQRENIMRGVGLAPREVRRTHCPSGHLYDEANTYVAPSRPNARYCRACKVRHRAEWRARRAAAA